MFTSTILLIAVDQHNKVQR